MNLTAFLPPRLRIFVYVTLLLVAFVIFLMPAVGPWTGAEWMWGSWMVPAYRGSETTLVAGRALVRELKAVPEPSQAPGGITLRDSSGSKIREMGKRTGWHLESGFIIEEVREFYPERQITWYSPEGRVISQYWEDATGAPQVREEAPWWWGVSDQEKPTAPWLESGKPALLWIKEQKERAESR